MNSAADLGGTSMVLDVTALAFVQIIKYERDRTLRDRLDSDQFKRRQQVKPVKAVSLLSIML